MSRGISVTGAVPAKAPSGKPPKAIRPKAASLASSPPTVLPIGFLGAALVVGQAIAAGIMRAHPDVFVDAHLRALLASGSQAFARTPEDILRLPPLELVQQLVAAATLIVAALIALGSFGSHGRNRGLGVLLACGSAVSALTALQIRAWGPLQSCLLFVPTLSVGCGLSLSLSRKQSWSPSWRKGASLLLILALAIWPVEVTFGTVYRSGAAGRLNVADVLQDLNEAGGAWLAGAAFLLMPFAALALLPPRKGILARLPFAIGAMLASWLSFQAGPQAVVDGARSEQLAQQALALRAHTDAIQLVIDSVDGSAPFRGTGTLTESAPVRLGPGSIFGRTGSVDVGAEVDIICSAYGDSVGVGGSATTLWDYTRGGWISDSSINTGTRNPVASACSGSAEHPTPSSFRATPQTGPFVLASDRFLYRRSNGDAIRRVRAGALIEVVCVSNGIAGQAGYKTTMGVYILNSLQDYGAAKNLPTC